MSLPVWARVASNRCLSRPAPLGASAKDQLDENKLHAQVCSGAMALPDAQQAMATDWYAAWQHYLGATPTPTRTPAPPPAVVAPPAPAPAGGSAYYLSLIHISEPTRPY